MSGAGNGSDSCNAVSFAGTNYNTFFTSNKFSSLSNDQWTIVGSVQGNGTSTSPKDNSFTDKIEIALPGKFSISQNYPNPFNPVTKIDYEIPENGNVDINIFDMTGREVAVLVNKEQQVGYYTIQFNGSNLSSGTYFYRIAVNGINKQFIETKKMMILK